MSPLLITILGPILKNVLGGIMEKLPLPQGEKDRAAVEVDKALAANAGEIAAAEAAIASSRQAEWIADVTSSSWLAKNWRPLTGIACVAMFLWEGIMRQVLNTMLWYFSSSMPIPKTDIDLFDAVMWVLLALIGVRSAEKITGIRTVK